MESLDYITDSYSMEVIGVVIVERIWSKYQAYSEGKTMDKRIDRMAEDIARLKGKLDK